jgi:hypothetical protein
MRNSFVSSKKPKPTGDRQLDRPDTSTNWQLAKMEADQLVDALSFQGCFFDGFIC